MVRRACESCGRDEPEDDLVAVHRVYVLAESWRDVTDGIEGQQVRVLDEVERWCFACRSQYPHQPIGA